VPDFVGSATWKRRYGVSEEEQSVWLEQQRGNWRRRRQKPTR